MKLKNLIDKIRHSDIDISDDGAIYDFIVKHGGPFGDCDEDIDPVEELFVDVTEELAKGEAGML